MQSQQSSYLLDTLCFCCHNSCQGALAPWIQVKYMIEKNSDWQSGWPGSKKHLDWECGWLRVSNSSSPATDVNKESIALQHLQHHFCCTTATVQYKRASPAFATLVSFVDISIAAFIHKIEKATLLIFGIMHSLNLISFALSSFQTNSPLWIHLP